MKIAITALSLVLLLVGCAHKHRDPPPITITQVIPVEEPPQVALPNVPKKLIYSTYKICIQGKAGNVIVTRAIGTAVGISKRKLLTAAHLEIPAQMLMLEPGYNFLVDIYDADGKETDKSITAKMTKHVLDDTGRDLAILETTEDIPSFIELDTNIEINIGDWLYTIGAQAGESPYNISWGQLASKGAVEFPDLWQSSIAVAGGNSGGGVYEAKHNKLIGILVRGQSASLFVPTKMCAEFLK